jgi:hypothetical protein
MELKPLQSFSLSEAYRQSSLYGLIICGEVDGPSDISSQGRRRKLIGANLYRISCVRLRYCQYCLKMDVLQSSKVRGEYTILKYRAGLASSFLSPQSTSFLPNGQSSTQIFFGSAFGPQNWL